MTKTLNKYLLLFLFFFTHAVNAQELIYNKSVTGVCYAGNRTSRIFVPPPGKFLKNDRIKGGGSMTVYYTGFSTQATQAFEYAVSILESLLPAGTKTTVLAKWGRVEGSGVLGNSSITSFAGGWGIDAFKPLALYPVALAEKIAGRSLNTAAEGDIVININSSIDWYLGTDGNIGNNQYDLVTVVLHELCHGLGFFDSMNTDDETGWYGISSFPMIYDTFIENIGEEMLIDNQKFNNYSAELRKELTGEKLYFKGVLLKQLTGEERVKLYAPALWDDGSSISHLDENFTANQSLKLMTPFIDREEVIHNPGIFTMSIMGDIGWINTRIIHDPKGDTEENLSELTLTIEIESDTSYNRDKVALVYSYDGFETSDTIYMSSFYSDNEFSALVSIPFYNTELQYYFFTEDVFLRIFHSPSLYQVFRYKSYIGADTIKPVISHTPAAYYFESDDSLNFVAVVSDNIGIDTVYMEYRINEEQSYFAGMTGDTASGYSVLLTSDILQLSGGDSLQYRIFAKDSAAIPNISVSPDSGYYSVGIVGIGPVITHYATDFTDAEDDFFKIGFETIRPIGWQKSGLHTKHPYESPEQNGESLNYIAMLRNPLKFDESGLLFTYSDIALVEPGEDGALFGSDDFYDYVVIEASGDFGKTWFSLFDGYDAGFNSTWLKAYNGSLVDQNSTATGRETMFVKQSEFLAPSEKLKAGDTILVRFRLFSDPYAWGWGWAIQDLEISPLIDGVEDLILEKLLIYPNPGSGIVRMTGMQPLSEGKPARYEIFNTSGILVSNGFIQGGNEMVIDISHLSSGIYIITIHTDERIRTFRYSLIR